MGVGQCTWDSVLFFLVFFSLSPNTPNKKGPFNMAEEDPLYTMRNAFFLGNYTVRFHTYFIPTPPKQNISRERKTLFSH